MAEELSDRARVLAALAQAGLTPDPAELDALVASYPAARGAALLLHAVTDARYEDPALAFDPRQTGS